MKKIITGIILATGIFLQKNSFTQTLQQLESKRVNLPNGWSLSPIGKSLPLGDLPLNMAVSPNKKLIAVTNNGQSVHSLQLIDAVNDQVLSTVEVKKAWYGLKFSADGKTLYFSSNGALQNITNVTSNERILETASRQLKNKYSICYI